MTLVLLCIVIAIADGDTLTASCNEQTIRVRLAEIDAPEKGQAFGNRSRQALAALCLDKRAHIRPQTTDRYGRTLARVECADIEASAEQVRAGMAWVFDRYVTDRSLYSLQDAARAERRGLWIDVEAVATWDWRRRQLQENISRHR
jgi:endonuclease YncB( thermonuclease family)